MSYMHTKTARKSIDVGLTKFMLKIYQYMAIGFGISGAVAWGILSLPVMTYLALSKLFLLSLLGFVGVSIFINVASQRLSTTTLKSLFWTFTGLAGFQLAFILPAYEPHSVASVFFVTAATFGVCTVYGQSTKRDLTEMGSFMRMGLWGIIIASLFSLVFQSPAMIFAISLVTVCVMMGLIAYNTQNLRHMYYDVSHDSISQEKNAILGAMVLYTSVFNLFLSLLRILGQERQ